MAERSLGAVASADLAGLLDELGVQVERMNAVTRLCHPKSPSSAHRIEAKDGRRFKAIVAWSEARAGIIERAARVLAPRFVPRCLGRNRRTLLFEWVEGDCIGPGAVGTAATLLGSVHANSGRDLVVEPRLSTGALVERLAEDCEALMGAGILNRNLGEKLCATARSQDIADEPVVFAQGDPHPDNIVMSAEGPVFIDNGSWSIGPATYDLARAWWRWPLDENDESCWLSTYRSITGFLPNRKSLRFWKIVAAVQSVHYRHEAAAAQPERAQERLEELARP